MTCHLNKDHCLENFVASTVNLYVLVFKSIGAVTKYGTEGDVRALIGSPKLFDGKRWANKLLQILNMGHEARAEANGGLGAEHPPGDHLSENVALLSEFL